jgi:hypothetical protein
MKASWGRSLGLPLAILLLLLNPHRNLPSSPLHH